MSSEWTHDVSLPPFLLKEMRLKTMVQAVEQLELPAHTYRALQQIAKSRGRTPLQVIEGWLEQHQSGERVQTLRQEYQQLVEKDLAHTLTADEEKRLDAVCDELNALEARSEGSAIWQQQAATIDAHFNEIERLLTALPEKQAK